MAISFGCFLMGCNGINPGRLRHLVTIKTLTTTQNTIGEGVPSYTTQATAWAEIVPVSGREYFASQKLNADCTHMIRMRYRSIATTSVIIFGTRTFDILQALNLDERDTMLDVQCKERLN